MEKSIAKCIVTVCVVPNTVHTLHNSEYSVWRWGIVMRRYVSELAWIGDERRLYIWMDGSCWGLWFDDEDGWWWMMTICRWWWMMVMMNDYRWWRFNNQMQHVALQCCTDCDLKEEDHIGTFECQPTDDRPSLSSQSRAGWLWIEVWLRHQFKASPSIFGWMLEYRRPRSVDSTWQVIASVNGPG